MFGDQNSQFLNLIEENTEVPTEQEDQFEMLMQHVDHANAIGAKPKPAADEIVHDVEEIVMPVPVHSETREPAEKESEHEEIKRFMNSVIEFLL